MLVGRSLEINGNVYSRLMIEVPIDRNTEPGLQVCIFLITLSVKNYFCNDQACSLHLAQMVHETYQKALD